MQTESYQQLHNLKDFVKEAVLDALWTRKPRPPDDEKEDILVSVSAPARDEQ